MGNMDKPKILFVSDSPILDTGMGVAHREIASRLHASGKFCLASFGFFWHSAKERGIEWTFPWKQYTTTDLKNPYGHPQGWNGDYNNPKGDFDNSPFTKTLKEFKPNVVIAIGDLWMIDHIYFSPYRNEFRLLHEFPIDGEPVPPSWVRLIKKADLPVVMSNYALRVCHDIDPYVHIEKIPRGVNTNIFRPYPDKDSLRKKYLPSTEGEFVVGVFDRYQDRKQIPRAIEAFAKFKKMHKNDNCSLYLNMDINDGHSAQQKKFLLGENGIIGRYGIEKSILVNNNITVEKGVPLQELVGLYNCCDIKLSSSQGEGWGLGICESQACGIPNIGPDNTTFPEHFAGGRGLLAKIATTIVGMYNVDRSLVDTDDLAKCMEILYRSKGLRNEMSRKSREYALSLDWSIVFRHWEHAIDSLLQKRAYSIPSRPESVRIIRDKQEINIQGAIYENTGFSIVTAGFAKGLRDLGHNISITPRIDKPANYDVGDLQQLIDKEKYNDVEIINHMPDECIKRIKESNARVKIVYSPWELTGVKDTWIDMINRDADAFWCNSTFVKDIFVRNGACADKITVIPNGITVNTEAEPFEFDTDKKYKFLMLGNLGDVRKNVPTLIQAYISTFTGDDDVCLVLKSQPGHKGSDPTELCDNMVRGRKNPPEIRVIHKDIKDLSPIYKACDCFVTTSHAEGFCQPVLDALACGMSVIAPNYGGYLDFASNCKRFIGLQYKMIESDKSPVHIAGSKWCEVDFNSIMQFMRKAYANKLTNNGKNRVPEYNWSTAAVKIVDAIKELDKKPRKTRIYYENFSRNMWNDDNRTNIMRYAPSLAEFVDNPREADIQILDIAKLADFSNIRCEKYIVNFHCSGEWSEENIVDYLPYFQKAIMVYSHLDLQKELPELVNFVRGPWGTNHRNFFNVMDNTGEYAILNTGMVPQTEGIYESVAAADAVDKKMIHTGPNLNIKNKSYHACREFLNIEQLRYMYHTCSYTSGMRRIEGFEKTVAEGILCGSRPICFDAELYRYWYGDLVEYVKEGTPEETTQDLINIFNGSYRAVTEKEREMVKKMFSWSIVARNYWKSLTNLIRGSK